MSAQWFVVVMVTGHDITTIKRNTAMEQTIEDIINNIHLFEDDIDYELNNRTFDNNVNRARLSEMISNLIFLESCLTDVKLVSDLDVVFKFYQNKSISSRRSFDKSKLDDGMPCIAFTSDISITTPQPDYDDVSGIIIREEFEKWEATPDVEKILFIINDIIKQQKREIEIQKRWIGYLDRVIY